MESLEAQLSPLIASATKARQLPRGLAARQLPRGLAPQPFWPCDFLPTGITCSGTARARLGISLA